MTDRVSVAARIPVSEIQAVEEAIHAEHGKVRGYKGQFVQSAMESFIDETDTRATINALGEVEKMLADGFDGFSRRRSSLSGTHEPSEWAGEKKKQFGARIDPELKERFKVWVSENTELSYGDAVTRALREYRDLNPEKESRRMAEHLRDELDELRESGSFSDAATDGSDDTTSSTTERPYGTSEKIVRIKQELEEIHNMPPCEITTLPRQAMDESADPGLVDLIHKYCSRSEDGTASDKTVQKYVTDITDDLGLVEHPSGRLFVQDDDQDTLAFKRKGFEDLTTEERVEAVRVKLLQKADRGRGSQATAAEIQSEFFDGEPSDSVSHKLRKKASKAPGFGIRKSNSGKKCVYVDPEDVIDDTIREAAGLSPMDEREKYRKEAKQGLDQQDAGHPARANS